MTFSIIGIDPTTRTMGIAVASKILSVGALVPHVLPGVGIIATQGNANIMSGKIGIKLLEKGWDAQRVGSYLKEHDPDIHSRQFHIIDRSGKTYSWTGAKTMPYSDCYCTDNLSVAGNALHGNNVIDAIVEAYKKLAEYPLELRLLSALDAGNKHGGDKRGQQSASLIVFKTHIYPWIDLRVDNHQTPIEELKNLLRLAFSEEYQNFVTKRPRLI